MRVNGITWTKLSTHLWEGSLGSFFEFQIRRLDRDPREYHLYLGNYPFGKHLGKFESMDKAQDHAQTFCVDAFKTVIGDIRG